MRKRKWGSLAMAVWMICLFTMTSCWAAEAPADSGGAADAVMASAPQPVSAFSDVPSDAWYGEAVAYCRENGVMGGTSDTTFAPEAPLTRNDERITTAPGDIILYQGSQITVYYGENTWSFTRLGKIDDPSGLREALGGGDVEITFALQKAENGEFNFEAEPKTAS